MMPLQKRLGRGLIWVLSIIFVIHWIAADWVIRAVAEKQMSNRLADDGYSLMETLASRDDDRVTFDNTRISSVYNRPLSGHYYVVKVDTQIDASPSLSNYQLDLAPIGPEQSKIYHINGPNQRPLLVLGLGLVRFGHRINISVAEDLSAVDHDITSIRLAYFALTLLILGSAIALQRWDVKRALEPLAKVSNELEQIGNGQQQQISQEVPDEITPMVKEINRLLELVVRRLQQSRTAIGNLAHALKPPMAMLFKVAEHPLFDEHPELRQQLQTQTDSIHHCIERELKRARIAGDQRTQLAFNPHDEIISLAQLLKNIYAEKQLLIKVSAPDLLIHFDREDLLEMLGNLLDNACKWAKHQVSVEISVSSMLTISVADDGPGCSEADTEFLIQRGLRLDESIQGHGLGLAIVFDIVNSYHGDLQISRSQELGGFLAEIRFPVN
jgi:signal transduction histidine kinase